LRLGANRRNEITEELMGASPLLIELLVSQSALPLTVTACFVLLAGPPT